jgi:amino acid transporter
MTVAGHQPRHRQRVRYSNVSAALARNRLGVPAVVFFVMAAAAPLTVAAGGATTAYAVTGITAVPVAYLVVGLVLAVFSVGYVAMSRHVVNAGAFYAYVAQGLGRTPGVAVAWIALLAYNLMQVGLYGAFGFVASQVFDSFGLPVPWWVCALAGWAIVAVLGLLDAAINGKVLAVLLVAEIAIVVVYDAVLVGHPAGGAVSFATLSPAPLLSIAIAPILVVAVAGFVGFEATVVFSEETKDPRRTVARATYIAVTTVGLLYGLSAWAMSVATGPGRIVAAARHDHTELMFNLVLAHVGQTLVDVGHLLFLTSLFAALLAFHHTVARYLFALGRERVLPTVLGRTNRRTGAPKAGSLVQTTLALAVIVAYALSPLDPIVYLFGWLTTIGGLGVLILMTATSAAVIGYFVRHPRGESAWHRVVAPVVATLALGAVLAVTVFGFYALLGVPRSSPLRWIFPAVYAVVALGGTVWGLALRASRPDVYAVIGLGADSITMPVPTPVPTPRGPQFR